MSCYEALAAYYDRLTADVDYRGFADRYEAAFRADGGEYHLLLDLCCGTGSMSLEMSRRGYELISVDASEQMLMEAREKLLSKQLQRSAGIRCRPMKADMVSRWAISTAMI